MDRMSFEQELEIHTKPEEPYTVNFFRDGTCVGTLYLDPPLRFEGDAEHSARIFFDLIIGHIRKYQEATDVTDD